MSEEKIVDLPECGLDELIGLVKFNSARKWANERLNMDMKLSSVYLMSINGYAYVISLVVNNRTPQRIKINLEDKNHEGLYIKVLGHGYDLITALDNLKKDIKAKGVI